MSKFGDLIAGVSGVPVVETPAPVVEETPAPVVEEAPRPEEEVADAVAAPDFESMSKDELEDYGRTVGIELDRRHNKKKLIKELEDHLATS